MRVEVYLFLAWRNFYAYLIISLYNASISPTDLGSFLVNSLTVCPSADDLR